MLFFRNSIEGLQMSDIDYTSYERSLLNFVHDILINGVDIAAIIAQDFTHISNKFALAGLNEDRPPSFEDTINLIYVGSSVLIPEDERWVRNTIIVIAGHNDEELIEDGNGNDIQRGKVKNADLAEVVAKSVCRSLQTDWDHKSLCKAAIVQDFDTYFPTFIHRITITMRFPRTARESTFT